MKLFRWLMIAALLLCAAPLGSTVVAGLIANAYGCVLHEGFANPCIIAGRDVGQTLYTMGVMGWLMLFTLPIAVLLSAAWLVVELVAFIRRRRRSGSH